MHNANMTAISSASMIHRVAYVTLLAILAACSDSDAPVSADSADTTPPTTPPPTPEPIAPQAVSHGITEFIFRCSDGSEFIVSYGDQVALLTLDDEQHQLRQQPSGSGARYGDEQLEFIHKGEEALLLNGDLSRDCRVLEQQHQRLPGPDSRPDEQDMP